MRFSEDLENLIEFRKSEIWPQLTESGFFSISLSNLVPERPKWTLFLLVNTFPLVWEFFGFNFWKSRLDDSVRVGWPEGTVSIPGSAWLRGHFGHFLQVNQLLSGLSIPETSSI